MNHPEVDELLDLVRGTAPARVRDHVDGCVHCAAEVAAMSRLDAVASRIGAEPVGNTLVAPPGAVWDRIRSELASTAPVVLPASPGPTGPRAPGRSRRLPLVAAAAVVGVLLGGVAGYVLRGPTDPGADEALVARAALSPVGATAVSGDVAMNRSERGRALTITLTGTVPGPGYVEAWLLDPETNEMIGLGVLGPDGGTVTVPADADLTRFTTVDVSREPYDGDPGHSDESLARGLLRPS